MARGGFSRSDRHLSPTHAPPPSLPHFHVAAAMTTTSHGDVWLHSRRQNVAIQAAGRRRAANHLGVLNQGLVALTFSPAVSHSSQ